MKQIVAYLLLALSIAVRAAAPVGSPAALDATFGKGGAQFTDFGIGAGGVSALALQPDGKIVVAGIGDPHSRLARFNADGSLDLTFNSTGYVIFSSGALARANAVAIQGDGKIVVAGGATQFRGYALARFNPDGTPDTTFNGTGEVVTSVNQSEVYSLAIQADGKIVAAGSAFDFTVVRYNADGTLDSSFGGDGIVSFNTGPSSTTFDRGRAVAIQADGKIVVGGYTSVSTFGSSGDDNFTLARLNGDGSIDTTFNGTGIVITDFGGGAYDTLGALRIASDGKIVAAGRTSGSSASGFAFARYNADGTPDATFNGTGRAVHSFAPVANGASGMAVLSDGRILATGSLSNGSNGTSVLVARLTAAGALDTTFGSGTGKFSTPQGASAGVGAVAVQPDGKIVAGGFTGATSDFLVMRVDGAGAALDASFGSSGMASLKVVFRPNAAFAVAIQTDGRIIAAGDTANQGSPPFSMARYNNDGTLDATFGAGGRVSDSGPFGLLSAAHARDVAIQPDARIVVAGSYEDSCLNTGCFPGSSFLVSRYSTTGVKEIQVLVRPENYSVTNAMRLQGDGKIVLAGYSQTNAAFQPPGTPHFALARCNAADLSLDTSFNGSGKVVTPIGASDAQANAVAIQADGRILAAGYARATTNKDFAIVRYSPAGVAEGAFLTDVGAGTDDVAYAIAIQADGKILVGGSSGTNTVLARFTSPGLYDSSFASAGKFLVPGAAVVSIALQPDGKILALTRDFQVWRFTGAGAPDWTFADNGRLVLAMGTGSAANSIALQPDGRIVVAGNANGGFDQDFVVARIVPGERSLVTHYYRSILLREPDAGGQAFWQGEASRVTGQGMNLNEVWFAMAQAFYFSAEYAALNRDNTGFVTDLYNTFFDRAPDSAGLAYWKGQLDSGLPREVLLSQFMFSPEFTAFAQAIFGTPLTRAEVNAVTDFYRGVLARLPDSTGFNFWIGRFRAAQCQNQAAIVAEVEAISSAFATSGEYAARGRTHAQYVGDLYNAFLRRGGDLGGVQFWIDQIATGAQTREQVRVQFRNSPEFQGRVAAIIAQGCL